MEKAPFPNENELVLATVTSVQHHSVFCSLDEYPGRSGMIHISEIASGRIRNIREHVKEGRKVVCKVLRVNKEKGYIDLSLRRVTEIHRRAKLNAIKQEKLAEKIITQVAEAQHVKPAALFQQVKQAALKKYSSLAATFEAVALQGEKLEKLGVPAKLAQELETIIKTRIKPREAVIKGELTLLSLAPDGVEQVKGALTTITKQGLSVKYKGSGTYLVVVKASDFKKAERALRKALDEHESFAKAHAVQTTFARQEA